MHYNSAPQNIHDLIKSSLTQSPGLNKTKKVSDFSAFTNQWTQDELKEFQQTQSEFSTVDATN